MKTLRFLLPASLAAALVLKAQEPSGSLNAITNAEAPAAVAPAAVAPEVVALEVATTNALPRSGRFTEIFADSANFDLEGRVAIYMGNVRVEDPRMKLTCDLLTAHVPKTGKIDSIVAEKNVVIDGIDERGRPVHATCAKATYTYRVVNAVTNETVELTGNAEVQSAMFNGTGTTLVWDRINNTIGAREGVHMIFPTGSGERTNAAAVAVPDKTANP